jgi:hypothetical protein
MKSQSIYEIISIMVLVCLSPLAFGRDGEFEINCPYWNIEFDRAGYVDITNWYQSPRHEGSHEMCTGDIAAACWYQNISTGNEAAWLTDRFVIPTFDTAEHFGDFDELPPDHYVNNNANSGWSKINDGKLQVKIHYEVVDLGEQDVNGVGGSPIAFRDANNTPVFIYSDRYILLMTYKFKNLSQTSDINNLEFYQMMHGHPAYAWNNLYGCYETANFYDPLVNYQPCDSNHQTGNFKYDITSWNGPQYTGDEHIDWMCFSATIAPASVDFNEFEDTVSAMRTNIENRNLNGRTSWANDDMAGAAKWNIGNLMPGQTKSITLALMYGVGPVQHEPPIPDLDVTLTKTDDISDCVYPSVGDANTYINYTIQFVANEDVNSVVLIDSLPEYVEFLSCTGGGDYNEPNHTITWNLGDCEVGDFNGIPIGDVNIFTVRVRVYDDAPQGQSIRNYVRMYSDSNLIKTDYVDTNICCVNTILYVDDDADPCVADGYAWSTAYNKLQTALLHVTPCIEKILVAAGTYYPTDDSSDISATFQLIDGVDIYGHFRGCETTPDPNQRNLADSNYASVLIGDINNNNSREITRIVTAADCIIDGFTITQAANHGIYCNQTATSISNCIFTHDASAGISADGAIVKVFNSLFENNNCGIRSEDTDLNVDQCTILNSNSFGVELVGIFSDDSNAIITNCIIGGNGSYGICAGSKSANIRNCDVNDNGDNGVYFAPQYGTVERCRIYRNADHGLKIESASDANVINNIVYDNLSTGVMVGPMQANRICRLHSNLIYGNDQGVYLDRFDYASTVVEVCNNTIVYNNSNGIGRDLSNNNCEPSVNSNIVWGNAAGLDGTFTNVNYNCIQNYTGGNNTSVNPQLDSEYHLTSASTSCINNGNPNFQTSTETDIDGEYRIINGQIDKGCDEFNPYDLVTDSNVNFFDFGVIAETWRKSTGQTGYNSLCDFYNDNTINMKDLKKFCEYWLMGTDWPGIGGTGAEFAEVSYECPSQSQSSSASSMGTLGVMSFSAPALEVSEESAIQSEAVAEIVDVNAILNWLDDAWTNDPNIRDSMTESEYLEFRNSIEQSNE